MSNPAPDNADRVELRIPRQFGYQLVFRQERTGAFELTVPAGVQPVLAARPGDLLPWLGAVNRAFGMAGTVKALLKLATPSRFLCLVVVDDQIAHYAWVTCGHCKHYWIEPGDAVIGPIWTSPDHRGRGLATLALKFIMNEMFRRGRKVLFIDTSMNNAPCLKAIANAGFGSAVASYLRGRRSGVE